MSLFCDRLRLVLTTNRISQTVLAERCGVTPDYINHLVNGRRDPSMANLAKVLNALWFVDARWLVCGGDPKVG